MSENCEDWEDVSIANEDHKTSNKNPLPKKKMGATILCFVPG